MLFEFNELRAYGQSVKGKLFAKRRDRSTPGSDILFSGDGAIVALLLLSPDFNTLWVSRDRSTQQ